MCEETKKGTLYLVATPIGNLEDMTFRAVRILKEVALVAAEDTRHTRALFAHFDIHTPLFSYHEHNKETAGPQIIFRLLDGEDVACVSDAGLPAIADPGADLVRRAIENEIPVTVLPGANAALTALIASGLNTERFSFVGFLPRTTAKRRELLAEIAKQRETQIFYEAPHRLDDTLKEIIDYFGETRQAAIGRELTKKFEEIRRGTLAELKDYFKEETRGEFVIVVAGAADEDLSQLTADDAVANNPALILDTVANLIDKGVAEKEAMRQTAKKFNLSRRDVYNLWQKQREQEK